MSPHVGAFGVGLVPGGQQVGVTYQPVTTAGETHPAGWTDGCGSRNNGVKSRGCPNPALEGRNPAKFCVLRGRKPLSPRQEGTQVKGRLPGRS